MAPPNSLTKELAIDAKYDQLFETVRVLASPHSEIGKSS